MTVNTKCTSCGKEFVKNTDQQFCSSCRDTMLKISEALMRAKQQMPEQRIGQILVNAVGGTHPELFYASDENLHTLLENYVKGVPGPWFARRPSKCKE